MSNWIDAHLHLTDLRIADRVPSLLDEARRAGIVGFGLGGIEPAEWERQKQLSAKYPGTFFHAFGLHPWWVAERTSKEELDTGLERLRNELDCRPRACLAIGETGLDFHPRFSEMSHADQEWVFRAHLRLALEHGLPLVLHVVRAHERALAILDEERRVASSRLAYQGIVHSFSDSLSVASAYLKMGFTLSISASVITRGRGTAFEKLRQTMVTLPATAFVFETDSPDQPLAGESGMNRPSNLVKIAEAVAALRKDHFPNETARELLDQAADTVRRVFKWDSVGSVGVER